MKRFIKNNLKVFVSVIISGIIFCGIGVYAANTYLAHDISYTPSNENFEVSNVEDALNELYEKNMDRKVYIYNNGIINDTVIGSFISKDINSSDGNSSNEGIPTKPTIKYNNDSMELSLIGNSLVGAVFSTKKIDLSNYNKLKIHVISANIYHDSNSYQWNGIFLSETNENHYLLLNKELFVSQNGIKSSNVYLKDSIVTVDLDELNKLYYLGFYIRSNSNIIFDKIWFE